MKEFKTRTYEDNYPYPNWQDDLGIKGMTYEQAKFVRKLRVKKNYTWRAVARDYSIKFLGQYSGNQLHGMAICKKAARFFNEDYLDHPWN